MHLAALKRMTFAAFVVSVFVGYVALVHLATSGVA